MEHTRFHPETGNKKVLTILPAAPKPGEGGTKAPQGKAPTFMVYALRDPIGANLDRIQIIKGWLDKDGKTHERIYDVVVSDGRKIDSDGRCKTPVGNTVDVNTASFANTIGDSELGAVWTDPDFDPAEKAFYYARVIEIPTPRWTTTNATASARWRCQRAPSAKS